MPFGQTQTYEDKIRWKLRERRLLPIYLEGHDAGFVRDGKNYFIDVRTANEYDFEQRELIWDKTNGEWEWRQADSLTALYDGYDVKDHIDPNFVPREFSIKPQKKNAESDYDVDRESFEKSGIALADIAILYAFYARKRCFYIQVEGKGLFYVSSDVARIGVPPFNPSLTLSLSVKRRHSQADRDYSFFAVIQPKINYLVRSPFDLGEMTGIFPEI